MKLRKDLTGQQFGRLTVIGLDNTPGLSKTRWMCKCSCLNNTVVSVREDHLKSRATRSCGCLRLEESAVPALKDLTGQTFGRLTVLHRASSNDNDGAARWVCRCSCPNSTVVTITGRNLLSGNTKSCGCYGRERNRERLQKWKSEDELRASERLSDMKKRCYNPKCKRFKDWGGRGITICDEWMDPVNGSRNFVNWAIENGFSKELTIDRIDNNGPYAPWNCRWVSNSEQSNNKTTNVFINACGMSQTVAQWGRDCDMSSSSIQYLGKSNHEKLNMLLTSTAFFKQLRRIN